MPYIIALRLHYAGGALLLLVTNAFALLIPWFMKLAVEGLQQPASARFSPAECAGVIIALALAHCAARIFSRTLVLNAARIIEFKIREALFLKLQQQDLTFFSQSRTGDILSRFSNDLTNVRMLTGFGMLSTANALILYVAAVALMLHISPWLTLWALLPFPLMVIVVQRISRRMFTCSLEVQEELGRLTSLAEESVSAVRLIKSYCREDHFQGMFAEFSKHYLELNLVMSRLRGMIMPVMALATGAGTLAVLFVGGRLVINGEITLGDFVAFSGYLAMLVWPTVMMGWILTMTQRGASSMERLNGIMEAEPGVSDKEGALEVTGKSFDIEFRNLSFSYGDVKMLDDISIKVCAGERVGITGDVGSGKSTLLRLIPRLMPVEDGRLFVGGQDVNQLNLTSLRSKIGYVPQEAFLFSRTILENIAYGSEHGGGDAWEAARKAGFDADIARFADGLDTVVGERGVALSGGQKQRLSIARALISERPILLLDDPLSAVDAELEEQILAELDDFFGDRTVLVVSHRMSVFRNCDRIIVLKNGWVAEEGRVEELLSAGGLYAEMCLKQGLGIGE